MDAGSFAVPPYSEREVERQSLEAVLMYAIEQLGGSLVLTGFEFEQIQSEYRNPFRKKHLQYLKVVDPYKVIIRVLEEP